MNKIERFFGDGALKAFEAPEAIVLQRTELGRFANCPHQGNLCEERKDEIETHETLPEAGKIIHAIAEEAIKANEFNLQDAADHIGEELPKVRPDLQPEALRAGKNLANEIRRFGGNRVLICEEPITRSLLPATEDRGEVLIVCELDLVLATAKEGVIIVLDYKSGYKDRSNAEARDDFQTCVGCWCLFGKFPYVDTIHWWYLNTRIHTRSYCRIEREIDESNFEARILETARIKLDGCDEIWPEPKKCSLCPTVKWCEAVLSDIKELDGEPKAFLDNYLIRQARCDEMLKTLKDSVKNGRTIYGSGTRFEFDPKPKFLPKLVTEKPKAEKKKKKKPAEQTA